MVGCPGVMSQKEKSRKTRCIYYTAASWFRDVEIKCNLKACIWEQTDITLNPMLSSYYLVKSLTFLNLIFITCKMEFV